MYVLYSFIHAFIIIGALRLANYCVHILYKDVKCKFITRVVGITIVRTHYTLVKPISTRFCDNLFAEKYKSASVPNANRVIKPA